MTETVQIPLKDKIIKLHFEEFESDINIDDLTKIDYSHLYAELITIPALMNRIGLWKAEAEFAYSNHCLDVSIFSAQRGEFYRKTLKTDAFDSKGNIKVRYATVAEIEDAVTLDEGVILRKRKEFRLKKEVDYMDSLYWSVKSKEGKLNRISESMKLTPEDFERELVEGKWNGILINLKTKAFGR